MQRNILLKNPIILISSAETKGCYTMIFSHTAVIDIPNTDKPIEAYEDRCIRDIECLKYLHREAGNTVNVLEYIVSPDKMERVSVVRPNTQHVPHLLRSVFGDDCFDVREEVTYDFKAHAGTMTTKMENPSMHNTISSSGGFSLRSGAPFAPSSVINELKTDVRADIWLVGGAIEKAVVNELQKRSSQSKALIKSWINANEVGVMPSTEERAA